MTKYDVVIIGGGLGGLLCGCLLSKEGKSVCILERNSRLGGAIQSFARNGVVFNTGFNVTESLGDGETLNRYFIYLGILDHLTVKQLDTDSFEQISFAGDTNNYPLAQGHAHFVERLSDYFPAERQNLERYMNFLLEISQSFPLYNLECTNNVIDSKYLSINAFDYIQQTISNPKLQQVLGGITSLYAGDSETTPLYMHALINSSFIRSAWRIVDGSSHFIRGIQNVITTNGGVVMRRAEVVRLGGSANGVEFAQLANGEQIFGHQFISNVHPAVTLGWVDAAISKRAHFSRIAGLQNSIGMFSLYISFKPQAQPYINFNHHFFAHENTWTTHYQTSSWPEHYLFYTPATSKSSQWAESGIAITYMRYDEVAQWANTTVGNRGDDYEAFKQHKTEQLLNSLEIKFPGIKNRVQTCYSSTPLTHRDYTGSPQGSAYGIVKNSADTMSTIISPKSRVGNLYFTGQNLNMHGILGVTIGAVMTCGEIIGLQYIINQIKAKS
jgi:all-trans-retinol 13,14-reductase